MIIRAVNKIDLYFWIISNIPNDIKKTKGIENDIDLVAWTESRVNDAGIGAIRSQSKKKILRVNRDLFLKQLKNPIIKKIKLGYKITPMYGTECLGFCQSPTKPKKAGEKWLKYLFKIPLE